MRALPLDQAIREIDIYLIKSEISNEIFVWKIQHGGCYQAYKDHARGKSSSTMSLFKQAAEQNNYPVMYVLETLHTTQELAYRHCIAWTRYFMDHGCESLSKKSVNRRAYDMNGETLTFYESIKELPLEEVLSEEKMIVSAFRSKTSSPRKNSKRRFMVYCSKKDFEKIERRAQKQRMTLSRYCKNMALDGRIVTLDTPPIWEYDRAVLESTELLKMILLAIYQNGQYYPADLENIQRMIDRVTDSQERVLKAFNKYAEEVMKVLPR